MDEFVLLAVSGNPIAHSKSPQMLNAALAAAAIRGAYVRLGATNAKDVIKTAKSLGISGINVTAPFKEQMIGLMGELSDEAKEIGAVNTITIKNGKTKGFNTDPQGVIGALEGNGIELKGRHILVLGAGGAAKAAAFGLTKAGAKVMIANRTVSKAKAIAEKFDCEFCEIEGRNFENMMKDTEIIVSTLSTAEKVVDSNLLRKEIILFDAVYGKETALSKDAKAAGCRIINGQEWLLFHGVKTFEIMTGKKVAIEILRKALADSTGSKRKKQNIALVGFSGSGKSTASEELGKLLATKVIHMDEEIEKTSGKTLVQIFEDGGDQAFRKLEMQMLEEITKQNGNVISCGGGIVTKPENIARLTQNCKVVWLYSGLQTVMKRIGNDRSRPLFNVENKEKTMQDMMNVRLPLYAAACDIVICSENKTPKEIAALIASEVGDCLKGGENYE
ncbi:shikimate dehydrogenase [Candidatus Micrarchaeota archaeon]|nr:shikimate dehydrogenase [Candidatus Micrarchaeota archaeon]